MTKGFSILIVFILLPFMAAYGQHQSADPYLVFPRSYTAGEIHYAFGGALTIFPRAVVEEEIRQIPMLHAAVRYGLPSSFSLTAQFSTVYITNVLSAGAMWSLSAGQWHLSVYDEISYWFGFADFEGFDTKAMGLVNRPGFAFGRDIDGYKVTVKNELFIPFSQHTYFGSASVGRIKPEIAGTATSIVLEQDLWERTFISALLRLNYARPNYQVWLAFSVQDRWLIFPEIQISLQY